ncbi:MAG: hypothetical protein ACFFD2_11795 [Promethearchaeota archaeon]
MSNGPPRTRGSAAVSRNSGGVPLYQPSMFRASRARTEHEAAPCENQSLP